MKKKKKKKISLLLNLTAWNKIEMMDKLFSEQFSQKKKKLFSEHERIIISYISLQYKMKKKNHYY